MILGQDRRALLPQTVIDPRASGVIVGQARALIGGVGGIGCIVGAARGDALDRLARRGAGTHQLEEDRPSIRALDVREIHMAQEEMLVDIAIHQALLEAVAVEEALGLLDVRHQRLGQWCRTGHRATLGQPVHQRAVLFIADLRQGVGHAPVRMVFGELVVALDGGTHLTAIERQVEAVFRQQAIFRHRQRRLALLAERTEQHTALQIGGRRVEALIEHRREVHAAPLFGGVRVLEHARQIGRQQARAIVDRRRIHAAIDPGGR